MELLVVILFMFAVTALINMWQVHVMSKPEKLLKRDESVAQQVMSKLPPVNEAWIRENDFEFIGSYRFQQIAFCVWRNQAEALDLAFYASSASAMRVYDLVSYFEGGQELTTSINGQTGACPLPDGNYKESIKCNTLAELHHAHQKSIELLTEMRGLTKSMVAPDFEGHALKSLKQENDHTKSLFLWQLRSIYWLLVKRFMMRGKTIETQLHKGWI